MCSDTPFKFLDIGGLFVSMLFTAAIFVFAVGSALAIWTFVDAWVRRRK